MKQAVQQPSTDTNAAPDNTDLNSLFAALTASRPAAETSKWGAVYKLLAPEPESAEAEKQRMAKVNAARMIDQVETLFTGGTNKYKLAKGRLGGIGAFLQEITGANPELKTYKGVLRSMAPAFAKAAGDTGNIALQEQIAQMKAFPTEFSTETEAKRQFEEMRKRFGVGARAGDRPELDQLLKQMMNSGQ